MLDVRNWSQPCHSKCTTGNSGQSARFQGGNYFSKSRFLHMSKCGLLHTKIIRQLLKISTTVSFGAKIVIMTYKYTEVEELEKSPFCELGMAARL